MLRVDPFTTYSHYCSICPLEFFTVFFLLFLKFQWPVDKCKSFTRMLQYGQQAFLRQNFYKQLQPVSPYISFLHYTVRHWSDCLGSFFCGPIISVSFRLIKPRPQATLRVLFLQVLLASNRMQHLMCREEFCNLLHYHCVVILFAVPGELSFTVSWFMVGFNYN